MSGKNPNELFLDMQQQQINGLAKIIDLLSKSKDATIQRKWIIGSAGETVPVPFIGAKTLYIDNTLNPDNIQIRLDGDPGTHLIPAFCSGYIACEGLRNVGFEGAGVCNVEALSYVVHPASINASAIVTLQGSILTEQLNQTAAVGGVLTFNAPITTIECYNTDSVNTGTFVVNGISINVPPLISYKTTVGGIPNKNVTISGATTYIVSRYV